MILEAAMVSRAGLVVYCGLEIEVEGSPLVVAPNNSEELFIERGVDSDVVGWYAAADDVQVAPASP